MRESNHQILSGMMAYMLKRLLGGSGGRCKWVHNGDEWGYSMVYRGYLYTF